MNLLFADKLDFIVCDVNSGNFGNDKYDVVFAKAALHHVEQLGSLMQGIRQCLKPDGHLVTIDFFGPTRFQWTGCQLQAANNFIAENMPKVYCFIPKRLIIQSPGQQLRR